MRFFDSRVQQVRAMTSALHLIHQPVPVAGRFDGDIGLLAEGVQIPAERFAIMFDADRSTAFAIFEQLDEDGVSFVGVAAQDRFHFGYRIAAPFVTGFHTITPARVLRGSRAVTGG